MENQKLLLLDSSKQLRQRQENLRLTHKERLEKLKIAVDKDGNQFSVDEKDDNKIFLHKNKGFYPHAEKLALGKIMVGERNLLYYKFEDERNIFKKTDSWSINYTIFKEVDHIVYETRKMYYQIPRLRALEFGEVIQFDGTEEKLYVPLKYWDKRKTLIDKTEERRRNLLGDSWYEKLGGVLGSPYMTQIANYLEERRKVAVVYPEQKDIFRAYKRCSFEHTKVVILGQDPYHDGTADGLAFSYKHGSKKPASKSLDVIIKEVERDVYDGFNITFDYDLSNWADQGVLLLNSSLTVEHGKPQSHSHIGWQRFIKITLYELLKDIHPKVYLLWGTIAKNIFDEVFAKAYVQDSRNLILYAKHPASDLYNKNQFGGVDPNYPHTFSGCGHFSRANDFLKHNKRRDIVW